MLDRDARFAGWHRPASWTMVNVGRCRACGAAIAWCKTPAGRAAPLDRDGSSHYATCTDVVYFRRSINQKPRDLP
jgi:hypothetical protein